MRQLFVDSEGYIPKHYFPADYRIGGYNQAGEYWSTLYNIQLDRSVFGKAADIRLNREELRTWIFDR